MSKSKASVLRIPYHGRFLVWGVVFPSPNPKLDEYPGRLSATAYSRYKQVFSVLRPSQSAYITVLLNLKVHTLPQIPSLNSTLILYSLFHTVTSCSSVRIIFLFSLWRGCHSGNSLDINSRSVRIELQPGHWRSWLVLLSSSIQILGYYLD